MEKYLNHRSDKKNCKNYNKYAFAIFILLIENLVDNYNEGNRFILISFYQKRA